MTINFYLSPDKFSAHYLRKELTQKTALLGAQVGTWLELLELARNSYCLPLPDDNWQEQLQSGINRVSKAFWLKSLDFDPETTTTIVSQSLLDLILVSGPEKKLTHELIKGRSKRGCRHVKDLLALHKKMGSPLPSELSLVTAILKVSAKQAVRTIKVHYDAEISQLNAWQTSLVDHLNEHAGENNQSAVVNQKFAKLIAWLPPEKGKKGLGHLQRNLFSKANAKQKSRSGLQWFGVRDYWQEIEVAAGMIQKIMADSGVAFNEIGLLLPESQDYTCAASEVFTNAGIPLSGLATISSNRDLGRELLYHFLLCRQSLSPSPMLMASLFGSPLLPWHKSAGKCQDIMDGVWLSAILEDLPDDQQKTGRFLFGKQITSPIRLVKALRGLILILAKNESLPEHRQTAKVLIYEVLAHVDENEDDIEWDSILRICRPKPISQKEAQDINQEGVLVFHPDCEPWKKVQHLLVLGFSEGNYPQTPAISPIIPEEDRVFLQKQNILIPTRSSLLNQRRKRFQRQLCAATQAITFLIPMLDSMGKRLKPSSSLGFMAQIFEGVTTAEDLILDLGYPKDRQQAKNLAIATEQSSVSPREITSGDLELNENLITKRKNSEGKTAPESPSGLEKMMVSPLAWLFSRYRITSREWALEDVDALVKGSIAHEIFERLFTHKSPLPQRGRIPAKITSIFNKVITVDFPFLLKEEWQVECRQMVNQFTEAAIGWFDFLKKYNLEILGEETWLAGRFYQHPIRGKADLICRAPNGSLLVVDYKTSKSTNRKKGMQKGFDNQASLYCQMLTSGILPEKIPVKLKNHLKKSPKIAALYYTLMDQVALGDNKAAFLHDAEIVTTDISKNGLALIKKRMKELRAGTVSLNTENDSEMFKKEAGITPYAMEDSPLISLFMKEGDK